MPKHNFSEQIEIVDTLIATTSRYSRILPELFSMALLEMLQLQGNIDINKQLGSTSRSEDIFQKEGES